MTSLDASGRDMTRPSAPTTRCCDEAEEAEATLCLLVLLVVVLVLVLVLIPIPLWSSNESNTANLLSLGTPALPKVAVTKFFTSQLAEADMFFSASAAVDVVGPKEKAAWSCASGKDEDEDEVEDEVGLFPPFLVTSEEAALRHSTSRRPSIAATISGAQRKAQLWLQ